MKTIIYSSVALVLLSCTTESEEQPQTVGEEPIQSLKALLPDYSKWTIVQDELMTMSSPTMEAPDPPVFPWFCYIENTVTYGEDHITLDTVTVIGISEMRTMWCPGCSMVFCYFVIDDSVANDVTSDPDEMGADEPPIEELATTLYPNPATTASTLVTNKHGVYHLQAYTITGSRVMDVTFTGDQHDIDCSRFAAGQYVVRVTSLESGSFDVKNLIVQR